VDDVLKQALHEAQQAPVQTIIIVGDHFSGNVEEARALAKKLRALKTKVFDFQPRKGTQSEQFEALTTITGGAFISFNPAIEMLAKQLPTTLEALAHYTAGGIEALENHAEQTDSDAAMLLLEHMTAMPLLEFDVREPFSVTEPVLVPVTKKEE
jgi:hypothetical protein